MHATADSIVNHQHQTSSAKSKDVVESSGQQPDSRATLGHTSEHYRGNNVGEVVFSSEDYLKQVSIMCENLSCSPKSFFLQMNLKKRYVKARRFIANNDYFDRNTQIIF